jgi:hypothetical protein
MLFEIEKLLFQSGRRIGVGEERWQGVCGLS